MWKFLFASLLAAIFGCGSNSGPLVSAEKSTPLAPSLNQGDQTTEPVEEPPAHDRLPEASSAPTAPTDPAPKSTTWPPSKPNPLAKPIAKPWPPQPAAGPRCQAAGSGHVVLGSSQLTPGERRVLDALNPGFSACYRRGFTVHPDMQGSATLVAKLNPDGSVRGVGGGGGGKLGLVVGCFRAAIASQPFGPSPDGKPRIVIIPVTCLADSG